MKPITAVKIALMALVVTLGGLVRAEDSIRIAHVYDKTGPYENYALQSHRGLMLGIEYATNGTLTVQGRPIEVIEKDTQLDPEKGRTLLEEAYTDDQAVLAIGPMSSRVALAMMPVAQAQEKVLIVEPAMANAITGDAGNRYVFRTGRSAALEAVANAVAIGQPGVSIATVAQDNAYGRDGIATFREALEATGAEIVHEEYVPQGSASDAAFSKRVIETLLAADGERVVYVHWAGGDNPLSQLKAENPERYDIQLATAGNILPAMVEYKPYVGMEGATYYYFESPDNPVNDWLIEQHLERFGTPPDFFAAGGMAAGIAAVEALKRADDVDADTLIRTLEGMAFDTPKGRMQFRPEDHQALQSMYHFRLDVKEGIEWAIPVKVREILPEELDVPLGRVR